MSTSTAVQYTVVSAGIATAAGKSFPAGESFAARGVSTECLRVPSTVSLLVFLSRDAEEDLTPSGPPRFIVLGLRHFSRQPSRSPQDLLQSLE